MLHLCRRLFGTAILVLLVITSSFATSTAQLLEEQFEAGSVSFDYVQWPFGGMEGSFQVEGPVWDENFNFPEGFTSGCGGGINGAVNDTTRAMAMALTNNPDGTQDFFALLVTFPEGPTLGSFPVDAETMTNGFLWIDDATNLTIPDQVDDIQAWLDGIQANHKFGSSSGTIVVTEVSEAGFSGTFNGTIGDPADFTVLTVTNGQFALQDVAVASVPRTPNMARLGAAPNPFNPQTTLKLKLEKSGSVVVSIFDLAGHRVTVLHQGLLDQGDHQWVWNGLDQAGVPQSGGIYFCRAAGKGWQTSTKLVLVP